MEKLDISKIIEWVEYYKDSSEAACKYFGYTPDEMLDFVIKEIKDFDKWKKLYEEQTGTEPRRDFDVIACFEELRTIASGVIGEFSIEASEQAI